MDGPTEGVAGYYSLDNDADADADEETKTDEKPPASPSDESALPG